VFNENLITICAVGLTAVAILLVAAGVGTVLRAWLRVKLSGGRESLIHILGMRLRGAPTAMIIDAYTSLLHSGEDVRLSEVESQYIANSNRIGDARGLLEHMREFKQQQRRDLGQQHGPSQRG
jgi:uncharacterized protein YqfA (UPF0365 family)